MTVAGMSRNDQQTGWTVREAHRWATRFLSDHGISGADFDSELLLRHLLGIDRTAFFLGGEDLLPNGEVERFREWVERRARREPVAYLVGVKEFWGLEFRVTPEVLIPRPETELLVETALRLMNPPPPMGGEGIRNAAALSMLDLGTGSGCIAVSLAKEFSDAVLWAIDRSEGALRIASENAGRHGVGDRIHFLQGDGFEPLRREVREGTLDAIVSNPPYIPTPALRNLPPDVREFEPIGALDGGEDGLLFYRRIVSEGTVFLKSGGLLLLEVGHDQAEQVRQWIESDPKMAWLETGKDLAGIDRVVVGIKQ